VQARETMQEAYGERFLSPALLKQRVRAAFGGRRKRLGWRGGAPCGRAPGRPRRA
jgi:hypothetical protein